MAWPSTELGYRAMVVLPTTWRDGGISWHVFPSRSSLEVLEGRAVWDGVSEAEEERGKGERERVREREGNTQGGKGN